MKPTKILIVEDNLITANDFREMVEEVGYQVTALATSYDEAIDAFEQEMPDLMLLDITLEGDSGNLDGIKVAKYILKRVNLPIIYISAHANNPKIVKQTLPTHPVSFISKPIRPNDLLNAIALIISNANQQQRNNEIRSDFFIKDGSVYRKFCFDEILYLQADGAYLTMVTVKKAYKLVYNLKKFEEAYYHPSFQRVHRSFIVNLKKVEEIDGTNLVVSKKYIPMSKSYRDAVLSVLLR